MKIEERSQLRMPAHAIFECKCCVCGKVREIRNDEIDRREGPICLECFGPMTVLKVKGR